MTTRKCVQFLKFPFATGLCFAYVSQIHVLNTTSFMTKEAVMLTIRVSSCWGRHLRSFVNRFIMKTPVFVCTERCNFKENEIIILYKFLLT